jgi:geranylgeranyl pyrophosphate synthase
MATLVHDDVLDGAVLRRGRPTVAAQSGVGTAVSTGNYLLAEAFAQLAATGDGRAVDLLSAVALGLSEGELLQMDGAFDVTLTVDDYLRRCRLKTANLFATAGKLGALLSGVDELSAAAVGEYGESLGVAFQIFDDILDFSGDEARTGKRVGTDLRDGTVTLPIVLALERRPHLAPLLAERGSSEERVGALVAEIVTSGALEGAREAALDHIAQARAVLNRCSDEVDKDLLGQVAGSVVDRFS